MSLCCRIGRRLAPLQSRGLRSRERSVLLIAACAVGNHQRQFASARRSGARCTRWTDVVAFIIRGTIGYDLGCGLAAVTGTPRIERKGDRDRRGLQLLAQAVAHDALLPEREHADDAVEMEHGVEATRMPLLVVACLRVGLIVDRLLLCGETRGIRDAWHPSGRFVGRGVHASSARFSKGGATHRDAPAAES